MQFVMKKKPDRLDSIIRVVRFLISVAERFYDGTDSFGLGSADSFKADA